MQNQLIEKPSNMSDMSENICDPTNIRHHELISNLQNIQPWHKPVPLYSDHLPEFPMDALPEVFAEYAKELSTYTLMPSSIVGWSLLNILVMVFGNRYRIEAIPERCENEPLLLYPNALTPSSEMKNAVLGAVVTPLYEYLLEKKHAHGIVMDYKALEDELVYMNYGFEDDYHETMWSFIGDDGSGTIELSPEALERHLQYATEVKAQMSDKFGQMPDWSCMFAGALLRITGLLHCARQEMPAETLVDLETLERAIQIADGLRIHPQAVYQIIGLSDVVENAMFLWKRLINDADMWEISKEGLFKLCKGKFNAVNDMEPALRYLTEMKYIQVHMVTTGGRPNVIISKNLLVGEAYSCENNNDSQFVSQQGCSTELHNKGNLPLGEEQQ